MSSISVRFFTRKYSSFSWLDGFKDVTNEEIKEFAVHCRLALVALETELSDRCNPRRDNMLEASYVLLQENANVIIESEKLNQEQQRQLYGPSSFLEVMKGDVPIERQDVKIARDFVWLISRMMDWSFALLMVCILGKNRLQRMSEGHRVKLLKHLWTYRGLHLCSVLQHKAIEMGFNETNINFYLVVILHQLSYIRSSCESST